MILSFGNMLNPCQIQKWLDLLKSQDARGTDPCIVRAGITHSLTFTAMQSFRLVYFRAHEKIIHSIAASGCAYILLISHTVTRDAASQSHRTACSQLSTNITNITNRFWTLTAMPLSYLAQLIVSRRNGAGIMGRYGGFGPAGEKFRRFAANFISILMSFWHTKYTQSHRKSYFHTYFFLLLVKYFSYKTSQSTNPFPKHIPNNWNETDQTYQVQKHKTNSH